MNTRLTTQKLIDHVTKIGERYGDAVKDDPTVIDNRLNDIDEQKNKRINLGKRGSITDFPPFLKKVFELYKDSVFRIGVLGLDGSRELSLLTSVLTLTMPNFSTLSRSEQLKYIESVNGRLIRSVDITVEKYKELGWKKITVLKSIQEYRNNKPIIQMLSELFHINLFIVDTKNDRLLAVYPEEAFDLYKMNGFIVYNGEFFEPLCYMETLLWSYDTVPFSKIMKVDKKSIGTLQIDLEREDNIKLFKIEDLNLQQFLPDKYKVKQTGVNDDSLMKSFDSDADSYEDETVCKNGYEEIDDGGTQSTDLDTEICENNAAVKQVDDIFVKKLKSDKDAIKKIVNLVKGTDLNKMSINDIQNYAKQLDINIIDSYFKNGNPKLKTKNILYNDIIKFDV